MWRTAPGSCVLGNGALRHAWLPGRLHKPVQLPKLDPEDDAGQLMIRLIPSLPATSLLSLPPPLPHTLESLTASCHGLRLPGSRSWHSNALNQYPHPKKAASKTLTQINKNENAIIPNFLVFFISPIPRTLCCEKGLLRQHVTAHPLYSACLSLSCLVPW